MSLKILTCNVRGINAKLKRRQVYKFLHESNADIVFLQETHSSPNMERVWKNEWGGKIIYDHGNSKARGVALLFKKGMEVKVKKSVWSGEGRYLLSEIEIDDKTLLMVNVYAPNEDNPEFFLDLFEKIICWDCQNVICGGDLNVHLVPELDTKGYKTNHKSNSAQVINSFMEEYSWSDSWRILNEDKFQYTWKTKSPLKMVRLDYFLLPNGMISQIEKCSIIPGFLSDHCFVELELVFEETIRGRGYWKFNTSLLEDKNYLDTINEVIDYADFRYPELDPGLKWEMIKQDVREATMSYSCFKANEKKIKRQQLRRKLGKLEKRLACINLKSASSVKIIEKLNPKIDEVKNELEKMSLDEIQGTIIRSKLQFFEFGEKNTRYFFALEKSRAKAKTMLAVVKGNGQVVRNSQKILMEQKNFYAQLYSSNPKVSFQMNILPEQSLTDLQRDAIEGPITLEEMGLALSQTKRFKSPGPDSLPADWYKVFYSRIKQHLLNAFSYSFEAKRLFISGRQGIISLLPKKGKDLKYLRNWGPIILLCADYKLIAKIIANRIKTTLNNLISTDQSGFIAGRDISHNLRKAKDLIDFTNHTSLDSLLISVDFKKAFDRVEYGSLERALTYLGFGQNIIKWVNILFTDFQLNTVNNGLSSPPFAPTRGLFQGNPISPYGFILIIELLGMLLWRNDRIKGIQVGKVNILLAMFADDLSIFIPNKQAIWNEIRYIIAYFEHISGLKVNYEKSRVYRMGSLGKAKAQMYSLNKLKWTSGPVYMLGVYIDPDDEEMRKRNFEESIVQAESILQIWRLRGLSLIGKILVYNSLVASLFVYRLAVVDYIDPVLSNKLNRILREFLWEGKKSKITLRTLHGNREDRGLGLVNLKTRSDAMKMKWVQTVQWFDDIKEIAYEMINNPVGDFIWQIQLVLQDLNCIVKENNFWVEVLRTWLNFTFDDPISNEQVRKQTIWFNSNIRIGRKPVFWSKWFEAGILKMKDVVNENGEFLTHEEMERKFKIKIVYLNYLSLRAAVPEQWMRLLQVETDLKFKNWFEHFRNMGKVVKMAYQELNKDENLLYDVWIRWRNCEFPEIELLELLEAVRAVYKQTIVPKLRAFQYHFLLRTIYTNTHLKRFNIKQTDLCSFCNRVKDSLTHMFVECTEVSNLWIRLNELLNANIEPNDIKKIFFNRVMENSKLLPNFLVLVTKYYIYVQKCLEQKLSFESLKATICYYRDMEYRIAIKKNKLAHHEAKWSSIKLK